MSKFKVGDRVKCVNSYSNTLVLGVNYIVEKVNGNQVDLVDVYPKGGWIETRFELVGNEDNTKLKAGDKIRFLDTPNIRNFNASQIGKEHILTSNDAIMFQVLLDNQHSTGTIDNNIYGTNYRKGDWELVTSSKNANFEVGKYYTKSEDDLIIEEAKHRYPIGTKFWPADIADKTNKPIEKYCTVSSDNFKWEGSALKVSSSTSNWIPLVYTKHTKTWGPIFIEPSKVMTEAFGLYIGDVVNEEDLTAWANAGNRLDKDTQGYYKAVGFGGLGTRNIIGFKRIDGVTMFEVSVCLPGVVWLKAEGFKEFVDSRKPRPLINIFLDNGWVVQLGTNPKVKSLLKKVYLSRGIRCVFNYDGSDNYYGVNQYERPEACSISEATRLKHTILSEEQFLASDTQFETSNSGRVLTVVGDSTGSMRMSIISDGIVRPSSIILKTKTTSKPIEKVDKLVEFKLPKSTNKAKKVEVIY